MPMLPNLPICPCCAAALLHTVIQSGAMIAPQPWLELGKGALLKMAQPERPMSPQPVLPQEPA